MTELKPILDSILPKAMSKLVNLGYDEFSSKAEMYPTLGEVIVYQLLSKSLNRTIEISLHALHPNSNGRIYFRIKRSPNVEEGSIYNGQSIAAKVKKYYSSENESEVTVTEYFHLVERELFEKYGETINGASFHPDKDDFRNV